MSQPEIADGQLIHRGQFGEVEIVLDALDRIGIVNEWCIEVGAGDGVELSNTLHLRALGWSALLVEADPALYEQLLHNAINHAGTVDFRMTHTANIKADGPIMAALMDAAGCPRDPDFMSIDIDGEDFWMWTDLPRYTPRVVCVEYGTHTDPKTLPPRGQSRPAHHQAGRDVIIELGEAKGYRAIATTECNVIFQRRIA
jgi:hypothetical protein